MVRSLKDSKAPGFDGIPSLPIKSSINYISIVMASLFNVIVGKGEFPTEMKQGIWIPAFKNGDRTDVSRYRPITVLSHSQR